ncbi:MAG: ABC transporter ATP-binding protein [Dehalococcoidia bacterium]|jgi:oligopeptide/dipeptide ABC transporter ATP-binding protein|nr:ABC transporter ATP-binding protein [Dehalococcoidia bacterium]MDP6227086.1 ABC transporter ATP-binding protein [Dehalococcoidia bacterium]MDP7084411.1 ABC transporter ATP-binding protein [Dehalococcoidia bacterium]MDP7200916.1 ABC transporter ATP-binding protein [Dehalococcoidia bacterium]MDP7510144.1 ABC transporter ATP-binding protein [Dehalococcoidia bacterium]
MVEALKVDNLFVRFGTPLGDVKALNGVSLVQEEGQVFCLVGESGAGKSTLALAIMGLLPPSATVGGGRIFFDGVDLLRAGSEYVRRLRGKEISMVFQDAQTALNPVQLVGEQLEEVILEHTAVGARAANSMAQEILREMGLPDPRRIMGQYPFSLSGGMCQRIMLAIGLVLGPRLLVADEPTSGLDVTLQAEILDLLKRLCREQIASILLITHDMGVVATMANQVGVIYGGTMVEMASVIPLFQRPRHPYTWALLQSLPRLDEPGKRLQPLPGSPPDMIGLPEECPFLPRCNKALARCRSERRPPLVEAEPGHWVACYNPVVPLE